MKLTARWATYLFIACLISFALIEDGLSYDIKRLQKIQDKLEGANRDYVMAKELMRQKAYFAAIPYAAEVIVTQKNWPQDFEKVLESLIIKTGPHSFAGISPSLLSQANSPSLAFVLGHHLFNKGQYKKSNQALSKIPEGNRFKPEALFIQASSLGLLDQHSQALQKYSACRDLTEGLAQKAKHEKLERYYQILNEQCQIHKARLTYQKKNYKQAIKEYDKIKKNSYLWPYLLLEKAWAYYYLEDPNRTLGLLVTYKSPLLESYFLPESEVLSALAYRKLCLWDDSLKVVDQYYNVYKERSDRLKKILLKHKNSDTYFLKMMLSPIEKVEGANPFIRNLLTQVRKRIKYSVDLVNFRNSQDELKNWLEIKKHTDLSKSISKQVHYQVGWRTKQLNHYIKKQMFEFINEIHRFSYEMFNIRLEALSSKREELYNTQLAQVEGERQRGSQTHVKRKSTEHFYSFTGEFWADELGDYSFGLKSHCESDDAQQVSYHGRP